MIVADSEVNVESFNLLFGKHKINLYKVLPSD
jgi:hypothetical protein